MKQYVKKYFYDMYAHLRSLRDSMSGGTIHYIVGNSSFYGVPVPSDELYSEMMSRCGFRSVEAEVVRKRNSKKELFEYCVSASVRGAPQPSRGAYRRFRTRQKSEDEKNGKGSDGTPSRGPLAGSCAERLVDEKDADAERQHEEQKVVPEHGLGLEHIDPELQRAEDLRQQGAYCERYDSREPP